MLQFQRTARGFTLIELMMVLSTVGILAAVLTPTFVRYIRRSRTSEAAMNLRRLMDGEVSYYETGHYGAQGKVLSRQFIAATGWTPAQGTCCAQPDKKCAPNPLLWRTRTWSAFEFDLDEPHYYSYQNSVTGDGRRIGDSTSLEASADLDCNGVYSLFRRSASIDSYFFVEASPNLVVQNEME